jgi:hypothetical protein
MRGKNIVMKTQTEVKPKLGRPVNPNPLAPVQLRIPRPMYQLMRKCAELECMPVASWIRMACLAELRRKKLAA